MLPHNRYKYDFYLPEHNVFIEYHGVQHYQRIDYFHETDENFTQQVVRDHVKKELVRVHKGVLLVIRYNFKTREQIEKLLVPWLTKLKVLN